MLGITQAHFGKGRHSWANCRLHAAELAWRPAKPVGTILYGFRKVPPYVLLKNFILGI